MLPDVLFFTMVLVLGFSGFSLKEKWDLSEPAAGVMLFIGCSGIFGFLFLYLGGGNLEHCDINTILQGGASIPLWMKIILQKNFRHSTQPV